MTVYRSLYLVALLCTTGLALPRSWEQRPSWVADDKRLQDESQQYYGERALEDASSLSRRGSSNGKQQSGPDPVIVSPTATSGSGAHARASNIAHASTSPDQLDGLHLTNVTIGGQKMRLLLDTGSSKTWLFTPQMPANQTEGHNLYNSAKSSSFRPIARASFSMRYVTGAVQGVAGFDTVEIGGMTLKDQALGLAKSAGTIFTSGNSMDGVLGMAPCTNTTGSGIIPEGPKSVFQSLMSTLNQPLFAAYLPHKAPGTFDFGTIDPAKFPSPISWFPVDASGGFWQLNCTGASVDKAAVSRTAKTLSMPTVADTGTSLLFLDPTIASSYWRKVPGSSVYNETDFQGFIYPCRTPLPDLGLNFGDAYTAVVPGKVLSFGDLNTTHCYGSVQSNAIQSPGLQILGDPFFNAQYVVFDMANGIRLGMAPLRDNASVAKAAPPTAGRVLRRRRTTSRSIISGWF